MSEGSDNESSLTIDQAIANLTHPDLSLRYYAAWWLGKFRVRESRALQALITALEDEEDRTELGGYPLRRNAARALGKLNDTKAVIPLIKALDCDDFYVREAAIQSLGSLGDRRCIPNLMPLLEEGIKQADLVPGTPHLQQPITAIIEALGNLQAIEAIEKIKPFLTHKIERVQCSAARSLYQMTHQPIYAQKLIAALQSPDINLRRVALSDLGASGYIEAAPAIIQSATENSFKLIALKGLLESVFQTNPKLSEQSIKLMTLMDSLL